MPAYAAVFGVAAVLTYLLCFPVRRVAVLLNIQVQPGERRMHSVPMPTIGGAAMWLAFLAAMGVASLIPRFHPIFHPNSAPLGVVLGATVMFAVGVVDDLKEVSAPAKAAGQVLSATVLYFLGVTLFYFRIPFAGFVVLGPDQTPLLTVLWVTVMANAINFIDGLDGLAAGVVAIAAGAFFLYSDRLSHAGLLPADNPGPLLAAVACGVCVGFLPHNFHPARIIMGDAGALFLGVLMAAATMVVGGRTADQFSGETYFFFAPLFIPFVILGVPIIDTAFAIVRRAAKGGGVASADKDHLHHRLMRLGHGHRRSVVILWLWTAILSGLVLYPTFTNRGNAVIPFGILALGVGLYTLFHPGLRHRPATRAPAQGG
ncbi:MAG TPA: MraY family glycosyltransferase [Acidimicrobiales bacterium]|nr:MraY family glycosyltransferase [Acidimicrobiales bacterium]